LLRRLNKYFVKRMKLFFINLFSLLLKINLFIGCGKSDIETEKDLLRKKASELREKIDSSQAKVDSAKKILDSAINKAKKESETIDSLKKKIESLKK